MRCIIVKVSCVAGQVCVRLLVIIAGEICPVNRAKLEKYNGPLAETYATDPDTPCTCFIATITAAPVVLWSGPVLTDAPSSQELKELVVV